MSKVKLKDVVKYSNKRIAVSEISTETYVSTDNLLQNKLGLERITSLPSSVNNVPKYDYGNILISNIRPYLKKIYYSKSEGGASTDVLIFQVDKNYDSKFIYYNLFQDSFFQHMMAGSKGTKMPRGDKSQILDFEIPNLDLPTQQKIAAVLSALDDKIELNNKINAELEAMAKTLYDYWFVQFDFPNQEGKPYKSSGGKMVYNPILKREIPDGWEVKTIGDYCESTGGFAFKSSWWVDKGEPVIKIKDIQENYTIDLSDLSYVDLSDKKIDDKFIARPGNLLIAMTGATVGKYAIVPYTEKPLYVNQRVGYFNLGDNPIKRLPFFINSLNQPYFREAIFTLASGAAQPNISNEQINNIQLLLPTSDIIDLFNSRLGNLYSKILTNLKQNQELAALRDWLLPMLMNGQVKVE